MAYGGDFMKKPEDYISYGTPPKIEIETKDLIELIRLVQKDVLYEQAYLDKLLGEGRINEKEYEREMDKFKTL